MKQKSEGQNPTRQRDLITQRQWIELSRRLLEKSRGGFSSEEAVAVSHFINYVAPSFECNSAVGGFSRRGTLLIATRTKSPALAIRKAARFLSRSKDRFARGSIDEVSYVGRIDA